jgi:hypothetical protein
MKIVMTRGNPSSHIYIPRYMPSTVMPRMGMGGPATGDYPLTDDLALNDLNGYGNGDEFPDDSVAAVWCVRSIQAGVTVL